MKAREIMTKEVHSCRPEASLNEAARIMWDHDCGCVPVVDSSRRIIGIVTDRDVCMAAYTKGLPLTEIQVQSIIPEHVYSCSPDDSIETIEGIMRHHRIRRIPVTDSESRLVGIISLNDVALAVQSERARSPKKPMDKWHVAETLAAVCAHRASVDAQPVLH